MIVLLSNGFVGEGVFSKVFISPTFSYLTSSINFLESYL
jgi:hypothetical protein